MSVYVMHLQHVLLADLVDRMYMVVFTIYVCLCMCILNAHSR